MPKNCLISLQKVQAFETFLERRNVFLPWIDQNERSRTYIIAFPCREHASLKKIHPQKMYKHARSTTGLLKDPFAYFCESRSIRSNNIHLRPPTEATNAPSKNLRSFVH
ncbi:unnamed protein product [Bursaphelenchus xylophilus]|uniref:(pine wood nematode) hypothetical protein n=1 Tax=Bursaphelenchus xylophilus TaxID=6326 RepID=A0A7I8WTY8_BURXY|nr:unnamed protein product [Bursaphelenchus xylophilus]CAG9116358.1 unnamed protein product [Bursaphelenchus xylophilus]